ncbi:hypothetical protein [Massilia sp. PWRC2]|uniref:hypothetical protein n=1 Tax=Massilia sp. PWRC2 TaxID=2804626 RepID=UPI003CEED802
MSRSLHLKVWLLLGYVALCTALVLLEQQEQQEQRQQRQQRQRQQAPPATAGAA